MGEWSYGVVLDAGSSGTRVYVYKWKKPTLSGTNNGARLPVLEASKEWTKKTTPGVSSYNTKPEKVGPDHLRPLFNHALQFIEPEEVASTPVFLLATAGMRLLPEAQRDGIIQSICDYTRSHTDFLISDCDAHFQVIPGDTEGLFGWMATNYLIGGFDHPNEHNHGKDHHTYGFLDMGGASSQIAFVPNATESVKHADDLTLLRLRTLDGHASEYRVFSTTWLGVGVNQARERYTNALLEASASLSSDVADPCLPNGLRIEAKHSGAAGSKVPAKTLVGTGKIAECQQASYPLLGKDAPCPDAPCLIHGVHTPAIDFDVSHFVGVSEYWYSTHGVFDLKHKDPQYNFAKYQADVSALCARPWDDLLGGLKAKEWGDDVDEEKLRYVCFKASWLMNVLHDGIGVPRLAPTGRSNSTVPKGSAEHITSYFYDPFKAINQISDKEVSWTVGKMLLYASSQIPVAAVSKALSVGYGPNRSGVESSSEWIAGGPVSPTGIGAGGTEVTDSLFTHYSTRRVPGFVLFALVLLLVVYFLLGRTRRRAIYSRMCGSISHLSDGPPPGHPRHRSVFQRFWTAFSPLSSRPKARPTYSTVPEADLEDPKNFELDPYDSENSQASSSSSFRRTQNAINGGVASSSSASLFDIGRAAPAGLIPRTDSSDLLGVSAGPSSGRVRSRQGSPTRGKR